MLSEVIYNMLHCLSMVADCCAVRFQTNSDLIHVSKSVFQFESV